MKSVSISKLTWAASKTQTNLNPHKKHAPTHTPKVNTHLMKRWQQNLSTKLKSLQKDNLLRQLKVLSLQGKYIKHQDKIFLNLASNDYLALSEHPSLKQAAIDAIQSHGVGSGASKLVTGHTHLHAETEQKIAQFKHAQAALLLPTGYTANLAAITTLSNKNDLICQDKLNHASLIDATQSSKATVRTYPHNTTEKLEKILSKHANSSTTQNNNRIIVTDTIFSMDGDAPDLIALTKLAEKYDAIMIIDEAHATGILGPNGSGLAEHFQLHDKIDITISTASKALGSLGGIITADQTTIDYLTNSARQLIYTTSIPPSQAAAISAAIDVIHHEPQRREHLLAISKQTKDAIQSLGFQTISTPHWLPATPIIPILCKTAEQALNLSSHLYKHNIFAPAIRPPTVAPNASRVRITLRSDITQENIDQLILALKKF